MEQNNIYQKLHQIQSKLTHLTKTETNHYQHYKYVSEYDILKVLKPLLTESKLILLFSDAKEGFVKESESSKGFTSQKIEKEWIVHYQKQAILINSENKSEHLTFYFWATGQNIDIAKAKGCAETYAIKYFLTKFFLIPTTDELDPDITKPHEHTNRLKNGRQETVEEIQKRHQERDRKREAELKQKYGTNWKLSQEYKLWRGNL